MSERLYDGIQTNTSVMRVPDWYLAWCHQNEDLQTYWRELVTNGRGLLQSRINPGDRVSHNGTHQISLISSKTYEMRGAVGRPDTYSYKLFFNRGGHDYRKEHDDFASPYWVWVPHIEQLIRMGYIDIARRLLSEYSSSEG